MRNLEPDGGWTVIHNELNGFRWSEYLSTTEVGQLLGGN